MIPTRGSQNKQGITLATIPIPAKALATCIVLTLVLGMVGALGQIVVHDIIPTFYSGNTMEDTQTMPDESTDVLDGHPESIPVSDRGDLFSDLNTTDIQPDHRSLLENEQFIWTLKWTHIHLFGMNLIFIFIGVIALFLDASPKFRTWLIVLPFIGVLIDISAMWLKGFVSPAFFWLHVPGGGLFGSVTVYVSLRALWEMWGQRRTI